MSPIFIAVIVGAAFLASALILGAEQWAEMRRQTRYDESVR